MARYEALFEPLKIKGLTIKNRFLSTSHCPSYVERGVINERYIRYHEEKAKGGIGLSQFGGATAVSAENSTYYGQIDGHDDSVVPGYRKIAAALHRHGAACTVQLTHGGRRERWDIANWLPAFSSSLTREIVHGSFPVVMEDHDIRRVIADFANAARRVRDGDVDGVELSCQAGTLIEQFWSPLTNSRRDGYGGSLANRMRLGLGGPRRGAPGGGRRLCRRHQDAGRPDDKGRLEPRRLRCDRQRPCRQRFDRLYQRRRRPGLDL